MSGGPLTFVPLFQERMWGGRALGSFGKDLPSEGDFGESWEVVDRPEAQSVVAAGPLAGTELHELWSGPGRERLFGTRARDAGPRFPLLVKLLDASKTLSVQVHPPPPVAEELDGEPKDEFWYVVRADPAAHLFAGLCDGVSEERFRAALEAGEDVSALLHRMDVAVGDTLFIPSGRVHALGAGCVVVEIQQNSDTTYRVYDFERTGADGKPRELHVPQSMASIDFADVEPTLGRGTDGVVTENPAFTVSRRTLRGAPEAVTAPGECALLYVITGEATCGGEGFAAGCFLLVSADARLPVAGPAEVLVIELPG